MITVLVSAPTGRARVELAARLGRQRTLHALVAVPDLSLVDQVEAARPDVLLLAADGSGLPAMLAGLEGLARPPIVLVCGDVREALDVGRLRAGVAGVVPRHATGPELAAAIEAAAVNLVVLHQDAARDLHWVPAMAAGAAGPGGAQPLTPREVEVLGMLAEGLGNKSIAARLGISDHTVKFHVAAILAKLHAGSRTEAVTIGIRQGVILV